MRKALVSLLFLFASFSLFSQTFSLTDTKCKVGSYYRSYNVLFDLNKTTIRPETSSHLDSIFTFLNNHPTIKLEIGVHTDNRSCESQKHMSVRLHAARARSIADYLIEKGINTDRLVPLGYGCSKLLIKDTEINELKTKEEIEAAHQKNRRLEFTIIAI